jgi:hypothetical protein
LDRFISKLQQQNFGQRMTRAEIMKLPPVFMRCEPAFSQVPFERHDPPVREGSGRWEMDRDPVLQPLEASLQMRRAWYPRRVHHAMNLKDGDIVGYFDERCTQIAFRKHWWELSPSDRRKLMKLSFMWVGYWDPIEKRRRIVWLPSTIAGAAA